MRPRQPWFARTDFWPHRPAGRRPRSRAGTAAPAAGRGCGAIPEHEIGLQVATVLARATGAKLELLFVVPTAATLSGSDAVSSQLLPSATRIMLDLAERGAREHLHQHLIALAGVSAQASVLRGEPAREVVAAAEKMNADLVVLATHGKAGSQAFWSGSVAAKIIRDCPRPLLLVPAK
ncbi:MAG: universal stress protein [Kiritimatiellaeota bacterium]|nr:universal stress protein [Kiritimatiellota bacterium]